MGRPVEPRRCGGQALIRNLVTTGIAVAAAALVGCSEQDATPQHRSLKGVIERIDLAESKLALRFYSEKHQAETTITGLVNEQTRIFINGRASKLEDLKVGERIEVVGRVLGHGTEREVVAVEIKAERAEAIRRQPRPAPDGSVPSSAPADGASPPQPADRPTEHEGTPGRKAPAG